MSDADAEAAETQAWLDLAHACEYLDAETHAALSGRYDQICAQLARMMAAPEQWCPTPDHDGRR